MERDLQAVAGRDSTLRGGSWEATRSPGSPLYKPDQRIGRADLDRLDSQSRSVWGLSEVPTTPRERLSLDVSEVDDSDVGDKYCPHALRQ